MNKYTKSTALLLAIMSLGVAAPASAEISDFRINVDGVWSYYHDPDKLDSYDGTTINGKHNDRFYDSYTRVRLSARIDQNFSFTTRIHSGYFANGDNMTTQSTDSYSKTDRKYYLTDTGTTPYFDQAFITYRNTDKNYTLKVGMQGAYLGQGMVYDATGNLQGFGLQIGDWRDHTSSAQLYYGNKQGGEELKAVDLNSWITPELQLSGTFLGYKSQDGGYYDKIFSYGTQAKLGQLTFAAEKAHNVNQKGGSNVASGYYTQLYTGPTSDFADGLPLQKVGTSATVLTYQDIGKYSVVSPVFGLYQGKKGWKVGYGQVITKGVSADIEYADMKDKGTQKEAKMAIFEISYKL